MRDKLGKFVKGLCLAMRGVFLAKIEMLQSMLDWICDCAVHIGFDPSTLRKVELSCEEALANVIQHAYQDRPEQIEIEVKAFPKSHVEIAIRDRGPPFNPLESREPDRSGGVEEREVGRLGIYFMRQYMDEVRYQREANGNLLVLVKKVTHSSQKR